MDVNGIKSVAILGSTGSIGQSTLDVISRNPTRYRVHLLSANLSVQAMFRQCETYRPDFAIMHDATAAEQLQKKCLLANLDTVVRQGSDALCAIVSSNEVDIVVAAIVGAAGLKSTIAAASSGKRVVLANKEALVMSGSLLMQRAADSGALIVPTDSEHNAIFQCMSDHLRNCSKVELGVVTPQQALKHPNWSMGPKISIDSATLMNKGLEVIEACTLFSLDLNDIDVLIHPESVIHSMVQYRDGSVLAQLGRPDMRTPIAHALAWPERIESGVTPLDFTELAGLHFEAPDLERFPCLRLAYEAMRTGGTAPTVLNAANIHWNTRKSPQQSICPLLLKQTEMHEFWLAINSTNCASEAFKNQCLHVQQRSIHEFGHFWVARKVGVKVLKFSIGMGKSLYTRVGKVDGTKFTIAAIPLGGYVRMLDERVDDVSPDERHRAFNRQPLWARVAVVIAGPLANFILAMAAYWLVLMIGISGVAPLLGPITPDTPAAEGGFQSEDRLLSINGAPTPSWNDARLELLDASLNVEQPTLIEVETVSGTYATRELKLAGLDVLKETGDPVAKMGFSAWYPEIEPVIGTVIADGAAAGAGMRAGDRVLSVDGESIGSWIDFVNAVRPSADKPLALVVDRDGKTVDLSITPTAVEVNGETIGRVGVSENQSAELFEKVRTTVQYPVGTAFVKAMQRTWDMTSLTLSMLVKLVTGQASLDNISGPISIAQFAGQSASIGIDHYINFIAMISISLAVLNLLPIPMLDGGHLVYFAIEAVTRRPVSERIQIYGQQFGLVLLGGLMFLAFYNDIWRLFQ